MKGFNYTYQGQTHLAFVQKFKKLGYDRFRITLDKGYVIIARFGTTLPGQHTTWLQAGNPGEFIHPHDFIQAVGMGMEAVLEEGPRTDQ